jgi:hypothetical protein
MENFNKEVRIQKQEYRTPSPLPEKINEPRSKKKSTKIRIYIFWERNNFAFLNVILLFDF